MELVRKVIIMKTGVDGRRVCVASVRDGHIVRTWSALIPGAAVVDVVKEMARQHTSVELQIPESVSGVSEG